MKRALLLGWVVVSAMAVAASCGKTEGSTGTGASGPHGPLDVTVTWTIKGMPPTDDLCTATIGAVGSLVHISLNGAVDPNLNQDTTVSCAASRILFKGLLVEKLGLTPQIQGDILAANLSTFDTKEAPFPNPMPGAITLNLDFFGTMTTTVTSSTAAQSTAAASTSGMGGMGGTGGMTGAGGSGGNATSSTSASTSASSTSGMGGAGGAPVDAGNG